MTGFHFYFLSMQFEYIPNAMSSSSGSPATLQGLSLVEIVHCFLDAGFKRLGGIQDKIFAFRPFHVGNPVPEDSLIDVGLARADSRLGLDASHLTGLTGACAKPAVKYPKVIDDTLDVKIAGMRLVSQTLASFK